MPVFVIAEAGVNHNGDADMAFRMIDAAADAGADAVKFQTFDAEELASQVAAKAAYQKRTTDPGESQLEMLRKLQLSAELHYQLKAQCAERGIEFLSTPFDLRSLEFLAGEMGLETLKIPSGEITNGPLLLAAARTGCRLLVSTGMSTLEDVREALAVIAFGFTGGREPSRDAFAAALGTAEGRKAIEGNVTLLHCTSQYPAAYSDVNLLAMDTLRDAFGTPVGYSDHTVGTTIAVAAAARGAVVIEKHFTLDRSLPGPDHAASLEPGELRDMVEGVRAVGAAMGDGVKAPCEAEHDNMAVARKSLVASDAIAKGQLYDERNLGIKRPGTGISPMSYWEHLGKAAWRDFESDEVLTVPDGENKAAES